MASANCPECEGDVALGDDAMQGEIVSCPDCGVELELVSTSPPKLEPAPEEEEDWGE
ncbi:MAG: lysine biosynthesis protein LysW [Planctomycetota bacterium]|nr:MAG: lysine biosynthesis protein LysW [Planctomycetota bacterium]